MRIGITFDLKTDAPSQPNLPDDFQEEFDSPATIDAIARVLTGLGHQVDKLGDGRKLVERLVADPPDFVFNIAEGQGVGRSREARVPAVLEMLGIPYSGSDPLTLAVTLDKECAKRLVQSVGVIVPVGVSLKPHQDAVRVLAESGLTFPAVVKPSWEGSSKGIRARSLVDSATEACAVIAELRRDHAQPILVEEYIEGDELTVGIVGNLQPQILGIMRVLPRQKRDRFIYSLEVKRDWENQVRYECPALLSASDDAAVRKAALQAYDILGCRDVSRVDFRLRKGVPYFLEVNPLPGLNPHSGDIVLMSQLIGWSYERLVSTILGHALEREGIT